MSTTGDILEPPAEATQAPRAPGVRLDTERLVLRDIEPGDVDALVAYFEEPESHANILRSQRDPARNASWLRSAVSYLQLMPVPQREVHALAVRRRVDDVVLGYCSLRYIERGSVIIGWHYGVAHAGQGYATEAARALLRLAFDGLGMERAFADCFAANAAAIAVLRKLGMRRLPGRLRDWLRGLGYRELRPALRHSVERDALVSSHL